MDQSFIESLPEAAGNIRRHADDESAAHEDRSVDILFLTEILDEFFDGLAKATGTASMNVAAGIALNRLRGKDEF